MFVIIRKSKLKALKHKFECYEEKIELLERKHKECVKHVMDARMVEFNKAWELFHGTLKESIEDRINKAADSKKETVEVVKEVVKEVVTYTEDSKIVAKEIKKMKSKNISGPNGQSTYYLVPKNFIEKILK